MKEQQFAQQLANLKLHHETIQHGIVELSQMTEPIQRKQKTAELNQLCKDLFEYCADMLHYSQEQSVKCSNLQDRLMRALKLNKSASSDSNSQCQRDLQKAQKKINLLEQEKIVLEKINQELREQIELFNCVNSFEFDEGQDFATFNTEIMAKKIKMKCNQSSYIGQNQNSQLSMQIKSEASVLEDVTLYRSSQNIEIETDVLIQNVDLKE